MAVIGTVAWLNVSQFAWAGIAGISDCDDGGRQNTGKLSASTGLLTATTPVLDGLCTEAHIISEQLLHCTLVANQCRAYYDDRI